MLSVVLNTIVPHSFNDQEIVALSGAHALGRCHSDRSGFEGKWQPVPDRMSNQYYKLLLKLKWEPRKWDGPFQYQAAAPGADDDDEKLMMLPTDYALIQDPKFRPWVEKYAEDKDLFFDHFAKVFAKLIELGIHRNEEGIATFDHLHKKAQYKAAPQKSAEPGAPGAGDGVASPLKKENQKGVEHARARL